MWKTSLVRRVTVLMVLVGSFAALLYLMFVPRVTVEQVIRTINISLPVGTPKAEVLKWLSSQSHIRYKGEFGKVEAEHTDGIAAYYPEHLILDTFCIKCPENKGMCEP